MRDFFTGYQGVLALFLLTCTTGVPLTRFARPYNPLLLNLHKLIALAAVILTVLAVRAQRSAGEMVRLDTLAVTLGVAAVILVVGLFVSGGLLSAGRQAQVLLTVHRAVPLAAVVTAVVFVYLVARRALP